VEGKTSGRVIASVRTTRRGQRPWHVQTELIWILLSRKIARTGADKDRWPHINPLFLDRRDACRQRDGVTAIVMTAGRMIDLISSSRKRSPLQTGELGKGAIMIRQHQRAGRQHWKYSHVGFGASELAGPERDVDSAKPVDHEANSIVVAGYGAAPIWF
jgi:hypothetical protein